MEATVIKFIDDEQLGDKVADCPLLSSYNRHGSFAGHMATVNKLRISQPPSKADTELSESVNM